MATRSELFHAEQQRHPSKTAKKRAKAQSVKKGRSKRAAHAHENAHAAKHASVALEGKSAKGRASRKSTRKSANHARSDGAVSELRAERSHATPEARFRNRK